MAWLPNLTMPVRTGTHDNTAFGIGLCLDAARVLGRTDVVAAIVEHSHRFFDADRDYPVEWEPSGHDFLSAELSEAHLMARVFQVEGRGEEFGGWLSAFLPRLGQADDTLLTVPDVLDGTDGRLAHLYGLSLSRAWQLRALAPWLDEDAQHRIAQVTARQVSAVWNPRSMTGTSWPPTGWCRSRYRRSWRQVRATHSWECDAPTEPWL